MENNLNNILEEMDNLYTNFINCRAYFSHLNETHIGLKEIKTAPFYSEKGFKITFKFNKPLTKEHIKKNNEIAHWINQNFIVRLCAMLESYKILSGNVVIDPSVIGCEDLDLLRRLRNKFAHGSGKYNTSEPEEVKLMNKIISYFNLDIKNPIEFPLPIDTVITPLFRKCLEYVRIKTQN